MFCYILMLHSMILPMTYNIFKERKGEQNANKARNQEIQRSCIRYNYRCNGVTDKFCRNIPCTNHTKKSFALPYIIQLRSHSPKHKIIQEVQHIKPGQHQEIKEIISYKFSTYAKDNHAHSQYKCYDKVQPGFIHFMLQFIIDKPCRP